MNDDQSAHEHALTDADGPGWPGGESGATDPGQEPKGSPMAGTAAQDEAAGSAADEDAAPGKRGKKPRSFWRELPILIVVALVIALVIKSFVVQAFFIPSSSMENTLRHRRQGAGEQARLSLPQIEPGDIIVFNGSGSWDAVAPASPAGSNPIAVSRRDPPAAAAVDRRAVRHGAWAA